MMPRVAAFPVCRDHPLHWPLEETPASLRRNPAEEIYWFEWKHSFGSRATIRVARSSDDVLVTRQYRPSFRRTPRQSARLTMADWALLEDAVVAAGFWSLDERNLLADLTRVDGATWLVAGHREGEYHSIQRQSPHDALYDLGRLLFG